MLSQRTAASFNFGAWRRTGAQILYLCQIRYHHPRVRLAVLDEITPALTRRFEFSAPATLPPASIASVLQVLENCYLPWQLCRQDCARISQLLRQGPLNVTGQARRQDESSLEHFAKHASPPPVFCPLTPLCASASNVISESSTTQRPSFIQASPAHPSAIQGLSLASLWPFPNLQ
jgi:hypothetical protein